MIQKTAAVAAALLLVCAAYGQTASTQPVNVSSRPEAKAPDLCKGAIDPFNLGEQRSRFLRAAGVDNELTTEEFAADAKRADGFVRKFDRWAALAAYDKNNSKTIDWFEAKAYRQGLRTKVLSAFDSNKDGRLRGPERDQANRALGRGRLFSATTRPASRFRMRGSDEDRRQMLQNYDADGNGTLSRQERRTAWQAARETRRAETLKQFDADGDGTLSRQERRTAWQAARERRRAEMLKQFDADGDGQLNEGERNAMRDSWRQRAQQMRQSWELRRYDANGDGELDEKERAELAKARAEREARREARRKEWLEKYDADGDGELSREERSTAWRATREEMRKRMLEQFDADGDGELSEQERQKMRESFRGRFRRGRRSAEAED